MMVRMTVLMGVTRMIAKFPALLSSTSGLMVPSVSRLGGCVTITRTAGMGLTRAAVTTQPWLVGGQNISCDNKNCVVLLGPIAAYY